MSDLLRSVRELLAYTIWADRTLLEALRGVSVEDLTRESGTSFGSLAGTMAHILAAEQRWLARFLGGPEPETLPAEAFADRLQLALAFEEIWSQLEFFIASLTAEQLAAELTWTDSAGRSQTRTLRKAVFHLVNHSTYHRGQAVSLLRQLGYVPPATDLIHFTSAG
ncbi:MAG: DinB family protein [Holophagales bacterium]|nr:MAG: DinB family protein [Holophagales bacterium]